MPEVFQLQSPSRTAAATCLGLHPQGRFLREGCLAGIHCPFIHSPLRSPL